MIFIFPGYSYLRAFLPISFVSHELLYKVARSKSSLLAASLIRSAIFEMISKIRFSEILPNYLYA